MKKLLFCAALIAAVAVTSCKSDDNGGDDGCETCDFNGESLELCDNGDGTYSLDGEEIELDGQSFNEIVFALELLGASCN